MNESFKKNMFMLVIAGIIGLIFSIQYNTQKLHSKDENLNDVVEDLKKEYGKLKDENMNLKNNVEDLEKEIDVYQEGNLDENLISEKFASELKKYKRLSGYENIQGEGVVITIDDRSEDVIQENYLVLNHGVILQIISILNATEAEGVSINGERYTSFTEIVPAGNHIEINGRSHGSPIIIEAIGDSQKLENSLNLKGGLIWYLRQKDNIQIDIEKKDNVKIKKYDKKLEFIYSDIYTDQ